MYTAAEITAAARETFDAAREAGLDPAAALDNAGEAVAALVGDRTGFFDQNTLTWTFDFDGPAIEVVTCTPVDTLTALDLAATQREQPGGRAYVLSVAGHAQAVQLLHYPDANRAGLAWGADAIWSDVPAGASPEQIAEQILSGDVRA